eukprot:TRINITY_DN1107_c0_g1_i3.p1 TRINITY_DN1107_c0_g1~~TRINITY_DN1107_c0_g1_i3.p1  ORF type:complete len:525 (+),score=74.69 TRINITY_DN1107_c0_g1_i3:56-1630(+)
METTPVRCRRVPRTLLREHTPVSDKPALDKKIKQSFQPGKQLAISASKAAATAGTPEILVHPSNYNFSTNCDEVAFDQKGASSEIETLLKCFIGLEAVLQVLALRRQRALLFQVRADVELSTGKSFTDDRLARILTLSKGMIRARWSCPGGDVELLQVVDMELRAPHPNELPWRRAAFLQATSVVGSADEIEMLELPRRRSTVERSPNQRTDTVETRCHSAAQTPNEPDPQQTSRLNAKERMEQLRIRLRKRQAASQSGVAQAIVEMRKKLRLNENATVLHGIVAQLFSRNERRPDGLRLWCNKQHDTGKAADATSSTSEEEVVSAATSKNLAMQAMSPLERAEASEAIAHLASRADTWFATERGSMNVGARFLRRLPGGSASHVLDTLRRERREIQQRIDILTCGPDASVDLAATLQLHGHISAALFVGESRPAREVDQPLGALRQTESAEAVSQRAAAETTCLHTRPPKKAATRRLYVKQAPMLPCVQQQDQQLKRKADKIEMQVRVAKRSRVSRELCAATC